jgi:hypothetical protein
MIISAPRSSPQSIAAVRHPVLRIEVSSTSTKTGGAHEYEYRKPLRQRMIEDMNARKLCAGTQSGHIHSCKRFAAFLKRSLVRSSPPGMLYAAARHAGVDR